MFNTKPRAKSARMKQMREDLSIITGVHNFRRTFVKQELPVGQFGRMQSFGKENHRSSAVFTRHPSQSSSSFMAEKKVFGEQSAPDVSVCYPPPLVTPAICRAAKMGRFTGPEGFTRSTRWPACSSDPVVRKPACSSTSEAILRIENINPNGFRQPMSSMLKRVQPPPSTPAPSKTTNGQAFMCTNSDYLLQSPWVTRSDSTNSTSFLTSSNTPLPQVTSKYTVQELIGSLLGDGPDIPGITRTPTTPNINFSINLDLSTPSSNSTNSSSPNVATTSSAVSPFFGGGGCGGLDFIRSMYGSDDENQTPTAMCLF